MSIARQIESKPDSVFSQFTTGCSRFAGQPAMLALCTAIMVCSVLAFVHGKGTLIDGAHLAIGIVTLLFLPILQATQNRDGAALQAKIDELILANAKARDELIGLEDRQENEIERIRTDEGQRAATARR
jgi:low affinity Fe/Cu permease